MDYLKSGFAIVRESVDLRFRSAALASREWLAPNYVRVRLMGPDLVGFTSPGADDHLRLFFAESETSVVEELRAAPSREYTPLRWGADWLDIEFVVHGDHGIAARWAAHAAIGSFIGVGGPRGSARIDGAPGSWLLAGDETAIPAIRRFAADITEESPARIVVEVRSADDEVAVNTSTDVEWLHRGGAPEGSALTEFLEGLDETTRIGRDPFCFIAAEQSIVRPARALLTRWGIDPAAAVIKGYWKRDAVEYHAPH